MLRLLFLLALLPLALLSEGKASGDTLISLPPKMVEGFLANGLHYIILPNNLPRHNVECRLVMRVGSINESECQKGAAHFLEHMAFKGSREFPGTSMVDYFERRGMKYGRDINAFTGFDRTVYWFTLPVDNASDAIIDSTLAAISGIISSLTIDSADVMSERGVIAEELRGYNTGDIFYSLKNGYGRYAAHMPLGRESDIMMMTPHVLRDYYHRWYNPSEATVIIVGNINAESVGKKIQDMLGGISGEPAVDKQWPKEYASGVTMMTARREFYDNINLSLIIPYKSTVRNSRRNYARSLQMRMLMRMLENRLQSAHVSTSAAWYLADKEHATFSIHGQDAATVLSCISMVSSTLKQMAAKGCGSDELQWAVSEQIARIHSESGEKLSDAWCEDFIDYVVIGDRHLYDDNDVAAICAELLRTSSSDMQHIARYLLKASGRHILCAVALPENMADTIPAASVEKAWREASVVDAPAFTLPMEHSDDSTRQIPVPDNLSASHPDINAIEKVNHYEDLGLTEAVLHNGIHLLMRPTFEKSGQIHIMALGRGGLGDLPDSLYNQYKDAVAYVDMGGLASVSPDTLAEVMLARQLMLNVGIDNYWHEALATSPTENVQMLMNLLYEKMNNPGMDYQGFYEGTSQELAALGHLSSLELMMRSDPTRMVNNKIDSLLGNAVRGQFMSVDSNIINRLSIEDMTAYYKSLFSSADGLWLLFTGNFDSRQVMVQAANTFGRMGAARKLANAPTNRPTALPDSLYVENFPNGDTASIACDFIFAGHYEPSLKSSLTFKLMRDIVQNRLLKVLRQQENIVYSPYVDVVYHGRPQQTVWFRLTIEVKNENLARMTELTQGIINNLSTSLVSTAELDKMKRSFIVTKRQALSDIAPVEWKSAIEGLIENGESLSDFNNYEQILDSITPEDIRDGFKHWFTDGSLITLTMGEWKNFIVKKK